MSALHGPLVMLWREAWMTMSGLSLRIAGNGIRTTDLLSTRSINASLLPIRNDYLRFTRRLASDVAHAQASRSSDLFPAFLSPSLPPFIFSYISMLIM